MTTEEDATLGLAAITWPSFFNEIQCSNTMSGFTSKSMSSYLESTNNQKNEGMNSLYIRAVGGKADNGEHVRYSGSVVTPSSSFSSLPIFCPPPSKLSADCEHCYYFFEQYYSSSKQSMYEKIAETKKNDTTWHEEEWIRAQVRKISCQSLKNDQKLSAPSEELKDKRRKDETFELEL